MTTDYSSLILEHALQRFNRKGLHATTTDDVAKAANVGVGTLYRTFATKAVLLDATYAYALSFLRAPLQAGEGDTQRGESLQQQLGRWWHLTAQAAYVHPEAFDFWRLYRTTTRAAAPWEPLLGPFANVPALVERALARRPAATITSVPMSVLSVSLVAQWTAAVDLVLTDARCLNEAALRAHVLAKAYSGWWQGLGLPTFLEAGVPLPAVTAPPAPVSAVAPWLKALAVVVAPASVAP